MEETLKAARFTSRLIVPVCLALAGAAASFLWRAQPVDIPNPWGELQIDCLAFKAPMRAIHYVGMFALATMLCMTAGHLRHVIYITRKSDPGSGNHTTLARFPWSPLYPGRVQGWVTVAVFLVLPGGTATFLTVVACGEQGEWDQYWGQYCYISLLMTSCLVATVWVAFSLKKIKGLAGTARWPQGRLVSDSYDDVHPPEKEHDTFPFS